MRNGWLVLQSLALAVILTWPAAGDLAGAALGHPDGDIYKHLWTLWWMRAEALHGQPGLLTTLVNWPAGMELWPIEPLNGVLAMLLPASPVVQANVLAIVHLTLIGVTAGWFGGLVSRRRDGAFVASVLVQASAFVAFTLQVGVGELRQLWWLPLGLGCLVRARDTGAWRWFLAVAAVLIGATLSCFYYGFFLGLATAVYAAATMHWRLVPRYAVAAVIAIAAVLGPVRAFTTSFNPDEVHDDVTFERWMADARRAPLETFPDASVAPDQLVVPYRDGGGVPDPFREAYGAGRYLGLGALVLVLAGLWADPRRMWPWVLVSALALVLSFGTVLWWRGAVVEVGGGRVVLPLAWINRAMGYYIDPINFPARFMAIPTVALAGVAAGAARWRWCRVAALVAALDLVAGSRVPWPRPVAPLPEASALARVEFEGAVADLTSFMEMAGARKTRPTATALDLKVPAARRRAIAAQLALGAPFDSIPIERMDRWAPDGFRWLEGLPLSQALASGAWEGEQEAWRQDLWLLRDRGFGAVLMTHSNHGLNPDAERFVNGVLGVPAVSSAATLWVLPAVEATAEEAAAWREAQAARVAAVPVPVLGPQNPSR